MPEGPEVRRAADKIQRAIGGKELQQVHLDSSFLDIEEEELIGKTLIRVHTYSKAFVLEFSDGLCIYVHLQLYGVWKTGRRTRPPRTKRSRRIWLATDTHYAALYSATDISRLHISEVSSHPYIQKLGPDVLNRPSYGITHISRRLGKKIFSRRKLGNALLDQSFFAGIGNYLRSEILFAARLHPSQTIGALTKPQRTSLARAIHTMLHRAYATGGITTNHRVVDQAKNKGVSRRNYRHYVFARSARPCRDCGDTIQKIEVAGRRLYICPSCQPVPK